MYMYSYTASITAVEFYRKKGYDYKNGRSFSFSCMVSLYFIDNHSNQIRLCISAKQKKEIAKKNIDVNQVKRYNMPWE